MGESRIVGCIRPIEVQKEGLKFTHLGSRFLEIEIIDSEKYSTKYLFFPSWHFMDYGL